MADKPKKTSAAGSGEVRKAVNEPVLRLAVVVSLAAVLAIAAAIGVSAIIPRWFSENPRMTLRRVQLSSGGAADYRGYWSTRKSELLQRLGINEAEPLWNVDTSALRAELEDTTKFSSIKSAQVFLHLPDTLEIRLSERTPVAVLFSRGSKFVADESCMVILRGESMAADGNWEELPLITGSEELGVGRRDPRLAPAVALIMEVRKTNSPGMEIDIIKIELDRVDAARGGEPEKMVCFFRFGGTEAVCRAIFPVRNHEKYLGAYLSRLRAALINARRAGRVGRCIDLTYERRAVVRRE